MMPWRIGAAAIATLLTAGHAAPASAEWLCYDRRGREAARYATQPEAAAYDRAGNGKCRQTSPDPRPARSSRDDRRYEREYDRGGYDRRDDNRRGDDRRAYDRRDPGGYQPPIRGGQPVQGYTPIDPRAGAPPGMVIGNDGRPVIITPPAQGGN